VIESGSGSAETVIELIDTHAHLDFSQFDGDLRNVLQRAGEAGVASIVTMGYDLDSSREAVALAKEHANLRACVGVHPHEAAQASPQVLDSLKELSGPPEVVGIGEIGLDYYRDRSPRDAQRRVFERQLETALDVGKPVVVHDREAHADVMTTLRDWSKAASSGKGALRPPLGVIHCFSGDEAMARELFELGFYVSVAGPVTFSKATELQELVRRLPLGRLLVETDCPFLAPHPYRGKRAEPAHVRLVASKIAEVKDVSLEEVARVTTDNARTLFRLG
jgi:TatD DNase family protein